MISQSIDVYIHTSSSKEVRFGPDFLQYCLPYYDVIFVFQQELEQSGFPWSQLDPFFILDKQSSLLNHVSWLTYLERHDKYVWVNCLEFEEEEIAIIAFWLSE